MMQNEYKLIVSEINKEIDYFPFIKYLCDLEEKGIITLYAGTYSLKLALEKEDCDMDMHFYFYFNSNKEGFLFYSNRMGAGLMKDDKLFKFSHRYLYKKSRLSHCFFGEEDFRSGEFFRNKRLK